MIYKKRFFFITERGSLLKVGPEDPEFPPMDIYTKEECMFIEAEIPGIDPKEVEITIKGDQLTIQGMKRSDIKTTERVSFLRSERFMGPFRREIKLPVMVEAQKIKAFYKKGVLFVEIPLKTKEASIIEIEED